MKQGAERRDIAPASQSGYSQSSSSSLAMRTCGTPITLAAAVRNRPRVRRHDCLNRLAVGKRHDDLGPVARRHRYPAASVRAVNARACGSTRVPAHPRNGGIPEPMVSLAYEPPPSSSTNDASTRPLADRRFALSGISRRENSRALPGEFPPLDQPIGAFMNPPNAEGPATCIVCRTGSASLRVRLGLRRR